jgi:uncharacterized protein YjgD (DUF1641 family)
MNIQQITRAMNKEDGTEAMDLIEAIRNASDDQALALLDKIRDAVRKDTVSDVLADLKAEGETEAYGLIKENY